MIEKINKIVDYVKHSPENTNSVILKQMLYEIADISAKAAISSIPKGEEESY